MELFSFSSRKKESNNQCKQNDDNGSDCETKIHRIIEHDRHHLKRLRCEEQKLCKGIQTLEYALQQCIHIHDEDFAHILLHDLYPLKKEMVEVKYKTKNIENRLDVLSKKEPTKNNYSLINEDEEEQIEEHLKKLFCNKSNVKETPRYFDSKNNSVVMKDLENDDNLHTTMHPL